MTAVRWARSIFLMRPSIMVDLRKKPFRPDIRARSFSPIVVNEDPRVPALSDGDSTRTTQAQRHSTICRSVKELPFSLEKKFDLYPWFSIPWRWPPFQTPACLQSRHRVCPSFSFHYPY